MSSTYFALAAVGCPRVCKTKRWPCCHSNKGHHGGQHQAKMAARQRKLLLHTSAEPALVSCHSADWCKYTCAYKPGCLVSHNWLHTPDCKVLNEMSGASCAPPAQHTWQSAGRSFNRCCPTCSSTYIKQLLRSSTALQSPAAVSCESCPL